MGRRSIERLPKFAYFPFGGGPRQCIGNAFALMEASLILATVAQKFGCGWWRTTPWNHSPPSPCGRGMECAFTLERRRASDARDSAMGAQSCCLRISRIPCLKKTAHQEGTTHSELIRLAAFSRGRLSERFRLCVWSVSLLNCFGLLLEHSGRSGVLLEAFFR